VDDFGPPAVRFKKVCFYGVFFNFVTRFLCFPYASQFLSVFLSNNSIILCENDQIVNDPKEVTEIFNNFFVNVAKDIGDKNIKIDKTHPTILSQGSFVFRMLPNFYQFFCLRNLLWYIFFL
jgi:hypothetical protein